MKNFTLLVSVFISLLYSGFVAAQVSLIDFNRLMIFAEQEEPGLFAPSGGTTLADVADWLYRFYAGTQTYAAVHTGTGGEFAQGSVYVLGGPFGDEVLFIDTLTNLLALVDTANPPGGGTSGITNPGNGNCVNINLPTAGTLATYLNSGVSDGEAISFEDTQEFLSVSSTEIITKTTQVNDVGGFTSTSVNESTSTYEVENDLLYITRQVSESTTNIPGFPLNMTTTDISYSPKLFIGPASTYCEEQQWTVASVTQTITTSPVLPGQPGTSTTDTLESMATVDSVNESLTVPAGTFNTVRWQLAFPEGSTTQWTDPATGLNIKAMTSDEGNVESFTRELQSIE